MRRPPRRAIPATVLASALVAGCTVVLLSLVQKLTGAKEFVSYSGVATRLHASTWSDPWVAGVGVAAAVAGLVLLGSAALPGRPVIVPLAGDEEISAGVRRRGLHDALRAAAESVDGVRAARVSMRRGTIRVVARAGQAPPAGLADAVRVAVAERVIRIGPRPAPRVTARLCRGGLSRGGGAR
jgi:hypothetical protein